MNGPLKWHGGKSYLAKRIVALMPPHLHYVEAFAGGLAVLLERDPNDEKLWVSKKADRAGVSEVVNDLNKDLINFYRCLQNPVSFAQFKHWVSVVSLAREEFDLADARLNDPHITTDPIKWAVSFFVACRQSRAGTFKGFTSLTRSRTRRGVNGNVSEWLSAVEGLPEVHARLQPVVIENMDAMKLIEREDTPDTLFYLDPPYVPETRATPDLYKHEMTIEDHARLLAILGKIKGKFLLSGYHNPLYKEAAEEFGWKVHEFDMANHAAGGDEKRRMTEVLWCNF